MVSVSNLIRETSSTTGTGNLTLAAANGYVRFSDATYGFNTGGTNVFYYFVSNRDAAEWEIGMGHMSDANTLVRDTVITSSNGNAAVNFSAGTKDVTNDIPASKQIQTDVANTFTAKNTFQATLKLQQILEKLTITADNPAPGDNNFDVLTQAAKYYTVANDTVWTINIRGDGSNSLNSLMAVGESLTIAILVTNTTTPYIQTGFKIDGISVTPKWLGGLVPSAGNANSIDAYTITIIKTASATFTVLESMIKYA